MTTLATRMKELSEIEDFAVKFLDAKDCPVDVAANGLPRYDFDRRSRGSMTVKEWKEIRFAKTYPGYGCEVLNGDGTAAHGNTKLDSVRSTYDEP